MDKPEKDRTALREPGTGKFLPGNKSGGRTPGSRHKIEQSFLEDILTAWRASGPDVINRVIEEKPDIFLRVVATLMPKEAVIRVDPMEEMTDEQLAARIRNLAEYLGPLVGVCPTRRGDEATAGAESASPIQTIQ